MTGDRIVTAQATLTIDLEDSTLAEILYSAIKPETESATASLSKKDGRLTISINASDLTALRAAMNSYLAWVSGSIRSVESVTGQKP